MQFQITKLFIGGTLEGLTWVGTSPVPYKLGQEVLAPIGGSPYRIVGCERIEEPNHIQFAHGSWVVRKACDVSCTEYVAEDYLDAVQYCRVNGLKYL